VRPRFWHVELEIDREMLLWRGKCETDANLAVRNLACGASVLALHADGVLALLEKAGVVDDPGPDLGYLGHRFQCVPRCSHPDRAIVPR
jgi:hypothetical protein